MKLASERSVRRLSDELVGDNLVGEEVPLSLPLRFGVDLQLSPLVYVQDLIGKIMQLLEQNERYMYMQIYRNTNHSCLLCQYTCTLPI